MQSYNHLVMRLPSQPVYVSVMESGFECFHGAAASYLLFDCNSQFRVKYEKLSDSRSSSLISNLIKKRVWLSNGLFPLSISADRRAHRAVKILSFSKGIENQYPQWQVWYLFKKLSLSLSIKKEGGLALKKAWQLRGCLFYGVDTHSNQRWQFLFLNPSVLRETSWNPTVTVVAWHRKTSYLNNKIYLWRQ